MTTHSDVRAAQAEMARAEAEWTGRLPKGWPKVPDLADPATFLPEGAALLARQHQHFRRHVSRRGAGDLRLYRLRATARVGEDRPRGVDLGWYHLTAAGWVGYDPAFPGRVDPHGVSVGRPLGLVLVGWDAPPVPKKNVPHPRVVSVLVPVCPETGCSGPPLWRHLTTGLLHPTTPRGPKSHAFEPEAEAAWLAVSLVLAHRLAAYATGALPAGRPTRLRAPELGVAIAPPPGPDGVVPPPAVYPVDAVPVEAMAVGEAEARIVFMPGPLAEPVLPGWGVVQRRASLVDIRLTDHVHIRYNLGLR